MATTSFVIPYTIGLNADPMLGKIATGALFSVSSFPLKPAFDRFSRAQLFKQARIILERNEPLSEMLRSELKLSTQKRSFLR